MGVVEGVTEPSEMIYNSKLKFWITIMKLRTFFGMKVLATIDLWLCNNRKKFKGSVGFVFEIVTFTNYYCDNCE